ncbi:MAG: hypothetical protein LBG48_00495 [Rickettsiales bacterium]|jgi:hypothetical protein|nr:hypothetical protein [Rickettsiales bacterium]
MEFFKADVVKPKSERILWQDVCFDERKIDTKYFDKNRYTFVFDKGIEKPVKFEHRYPDGSLSEAIEDIDEYEKKLEEARERLEQAGILM